MSQTNYITQLTGSSTLTGYNNIYLISVTGTTGSTGNTGGSSNPYLITLPNINGTDGITYEIIREDITNSFVAVQGTGGNIIYQNTSGITGSTGSISLLTQTRVTLLSYLNNWYVAGNDSIQRTGAKTLFTSAFLSNSGNPVQLSNSGTLCYFPYTGSTVEQISQFETIMTNGGATTGTIGLYNFSGGLVGTQICVINIPPTGVTGGSIGRFSSAAIRNLNPTAGIIAVNYVAPGTGASSMNIYSLSVK